ncbi:MAG: hypothetical protein P4M11_03070 [Candidatus Pacebacteria bacterium]|nr:hypothetical protein [Candidatus Paceibacterota bacterium]
METKDEGRLFKTPLEKLNTQQLEEKLYFRRLFRFVPRYHRV